jgi:type II secretory pathway pseudopilin PulG
MRSRTRRDNRRRGLSLVEALISLSITAALLTAVGAAYQSAARAIEVNDQFFRASQAARVSVNQVMAEVRKCQAGLVDPTELEITTASGETRTYNYDSTNKRLTMTIDGVLPVTHTMASNVGSLQFDTDGQTISMTITVQVGNNSVTLNGSAIPRRTVTYQ